MFSDLAKRINIAQLAEQARLAKLGAQLTKLMAGVNVSQLAEAQLAKLMAGVSFTTLDRLNLPNFIVDPVRMKKLEDTPRRIGF